MMSRRGRCVALAACGAVLLLSWSHAAAQQAFVDDPLIPGVTPIRAVHITELRARIDGLRQRADLQPFSWTDPVITAGVTLVRALHMQEMRAALAEAAGGLGRPAPSYAESIAVGGLIKAAHVSELRDLVKVWETCTYSVSPSSVSVGSAQSSGYVTIDTQRGCGWTAASNAGWISIGSASGTGTSSFGYYFAANTTTTDRTGTFTIGGETVTLTQRASCGTVTLTPGSTEASPYASFGAVAVTPANPSCDWTATSNAGWLTVAAEGGYAAQVLADNPLGYWRLGETSTSQPAQDSAGSHAGTYVGPVGVGQTGLVAGGDLAPYFDTGGYVDLGRDVAAPDLTGSLEFWTTPTGKGPLIVRSTGQAWNDQRLAVFTDWMDNKYHVAFADGWTAQIDIVSASDIAFNVPTHVVVSWSWYTWWIYLNGVLDATGTLAPSRSMGAGTLRVGYGPGLTYGYAHGIIDEVALYDHLLPPEQVAAHYAARTSLPNVGAGLVVYHVSTNQAQAARTGALAIAGASATVTQSGLAPWVHVNYVAPPSSVIVAPGATISVGWRNGPGNSRDWLGLYTAGAPDYAYVERKYLSGSQWPQVPGINAGETTFTVPAAGSGVYEVRFFRDDSLELMATSGPVVVGMPTVTITSPASSAVVSEGQTITLAADANDSGLGVNTVDFYVDSAFIGSAHGAPWQWSWTAAGVGTHTITAVATNMTGVAVTSSGVTFSISDGSSGGPPPCTYSLSPLSATWPVAGGSGTFGVTTQGGCSWTAQSGAAWIHTSTSSLGSGSVAYVIDANPSPDARVATLDVGGQSFTVFQNASPGGGLQSGVNDQMTRVISFNGHTGGVTVTGTAAAPVVDVPWLSASVDPATATLTYSVAAAPLATARTGRIQFGTTSLTVTQSASIFDSAFGLPCDPPPPPACGDGPEFCPAEYSEYDPSCRDGGTTVRIGSVRIAGVDRTIGKISISVGGGGDSASLRTYLIGAGVLEDKELAPVDTTAVPYFIEVDLDSSDLNAISNGGYSKVMAVWETDWGMNRCSQSEHVQGRPACDEWGLGDSPTVTVTRADIESNQINVILSNANVGSLILRLTGPGGYSYAIGAPQSLGQGQHTLSFDRNHLVTGTVNHIQATWQTTDGMATHDLDIPAFIVMGTYLHTQYGLPEEGRCPDVASYGRIRIGNACNNSPMRDLFRFQAYLNGGGYPFRSDTMPFDMIHFYPACDDLLNPPNGDGFRNIKADDVFPYEGSVAVDKNDSRLKKDVDAILIVDDEHAFAEKKYVTDYCPACQGKKQIDNYTGDTACKGTNLGNFQTIRLPRPQ